MLKVLAGGPASQVASEENERPALDELAREGARRLIAAALEVEVEEYLARHRDERGTATSATAPGSRWWCATAGRERAS